MYSQNESPRRTHKLKQNTYGDTVSQLVSSLLQKITNNKSETINKLDSAALRPMLQDMYDQLLEQIADRDRAIECMVEKRFDCGQVQNPIIVVDDPDVFFEVPVGATTAIPFTAIVDNHSKYEFAGGVVTPKQKGWYNVYAYCYDSYPGGAYTHNLHIVGHGSLGIVDWHFGNRPFKMFGQQYVYCDGDTDTIQAALSHNAVVPLNFNYAVGYVHRSYMTISFVGDENSAFIV